MSLVNLGKKRNNGWIGNSFSERSVRFLMDLNNVLGRFLTKSRINIFSNAYQIFKILEILVLHYAGFSLILYQNQRLFSDFNRFKFANNKKQPYICRTYQPIYLSQLTRQRDEVEMHGVTEDCIHAEEAPLTHRLMRKLDTNRAHLHTVGHLCSLYHSLSRSNLFLHFFYHSRRCYCCGCFHCMFLIAVQKC